MLNSCICYRIPLTQAAGSYALRGATVSREATVVSKLRDAGAIVLGKATMGEWAQMRSRKASSSHGWSAYGGQGHGAYYPLQDPHGSSSGSAVAVSVGLALGSLATETSGSIVNPAERNNVVGIKPTLGLTSRSKVIPISLRQDTVGPIARTVTDAAYLLTAMAGKDKFDNWTSTQPFEEPPNYVEACRFPALRGARIGIPRNGIDYFLGNTTAPIMSAFENALQVIHHAGATITDPANFPSFDFPSLSRNSRIVLDTDFVAGLSDYLSSLVSNPNGLHSLHDITQYTMNDPREEYPNRDTYVWDRELDRNITNSSPESFQAYQANLRMAEEEGVIGALDKYNLDALIMPTFASFHLPAIAGLPVITVPLGFYPADTLVVMNPKGTMVSVGPGIPFGIAFLGRRWSEEMLIGLAYAFEQRTMVKRARKPLISPSFELGDLRAGVAEATYMIQTSPTQEYTAEQPFLDQTVPTSSNGYSTMRQWTSLLRRFFALVEDSSR